MNNDKKLQQQNDNTDAKSLKENEEKELPVKNPFDANDDKKITQDDVDSEQMFKEAQTERD